MFATIFDLTSLSPYFFRIFKFYYVEIFNANKRSNNNKEITEAEIVFIILCSHLSNYLLVLIFKYLFIAHILSAVE